MDGGCLKAASRVARHALRSLINKGHPGALEALGFGPPEVEVVALGRQGVSMDLLDFDLISASGGPRHPKR